jgi:hypothetical protein
MTTPAARAGPDALEVLSLLAEVADELVVRTARDTHGAVLDRVVRVTGRPSGHALHRAIAGGVYGGVGLALRAGRRGVDSLAAALPPAPPALAGPRGRAVHATVNGLVGDRLAEERPAWAHAPLVRVDGRDVAPDRGGLAAAFPRATGQVAVLVHGWCETEEHWDWQHERRGPGYPHTLQDLGWTPVRVRLNTGLPVRDNGVALAALVHDLTEEWPVPVTRIALLGHSMGGLVVRAAAAAADPAASWVERVTDVVTLGTPHLGAPLAAGVERGSRHLARLPETAAIGRFLDQRSLGVRDLVLGLGPDVPALPHARYRLVSATLASSPRHPVSRLLGDALVRQGSAYGRGGAARELFAGADVVHLPRTGHMALLNHPDVHASLREWLA